jgi:CheY-like chemotaxis protein
MFDNPEPVPCRRVLLVDDYPDALEIWKLYLEMCGCEVATAGDGVAALALAHEFRPDIIVLDLELPGMTGVETARALRRASDTSAIPLIAATGYSHAHQLDEAERAGFDLVLIKPCDPAMLLAEIDRLVTLVSDSADGQSDTASG